MLERIMPNSYSVFPGAPVFIIFCLSVCLIVNFNPMNSSLRTLGTHDCYKS